MKKSNKYRYIGQRLIRNEPKLSFIKEYGLKIAYVESYEEKKSNHKIVMADCTKVSKRYSWCCDYDFFITVYEPNIVYLTDTQLDILILHELLHIGIDDSGMDVKFYVAPHDVEEFDEIIDRYGIHWKVGDS